MMCLLEIGCLVFGIITLAKGRVPLSSTREVRGGPAYLIGCILLAPLPLAFTAGFVIGLQKAQQGQPPMNFGTVDWTIVLLEFGIIVGCALAALIVALICAKPKQRRRRFRADGDYDDYDDGDRYDRRRRDEIEDEGEEDDRPRRRRSRDYDYEDDSPRRRDDYDDHRD